MMFIRLRPKPIHRSIYLKKKLGLYHSTAANNDLSSNDIRKRFLDYFITENSHKFIRSSPVAPLHDKSLAFINAGMNQFKDVLLSKTTPPSLTVANSQKCIRIGGKHNDLTSVGLDNYHHTFFEMLGNWSFGKYFKEEACHLAWTLLTTPPYSIDPKRLYVTYFNGCNQLRLGPDLETKEIWKSLGVAPDHILGFGVKENFWEMGRTGPCGPCTEIHVDQVGNRDASSRVNADCSDVKELWNIVFIQYNRGEDGSLTNLPTHHVDTGMGFERLVALLQNKESNYDTDLFTPLFNTISKVSKANPYTGNFGKDAPLDTAYRILADHSRMITVALADNMFPDHNHKLRRILRRALLIGEDSFKMKNSAKLLKEMSNGVAEVLSTTYPEVGARLKRVHLVVDHEWEVLKALRAETSAAWRSLVQQDSRLCHISCVYTPGLIPAYRELLQSGQHVSGDMAFRLYDTHGLHPHLIDELCHALGLEFDEHEFDCKLAEAKAKRLQNTITNTSTLLSSAAITMLKSSVPVTDVSAKYEYRRVTATDGKVEYVFPQVSAVVQAVIKHGDIVERSEGREGETLGLILDRTLLYSEAGGQQADCGRVEGEGWVLECDAVYEFSGYQLHVGTLKTSSSELCLLVPGAPVTVRVDEERRLANMRNHTATHCLNSVLHHMFTATHQMGSSVTQDQLTFHFATYGQPVTKQNLSEIEDGVLSMVRSGVPVTRTTVTSDQLLAMDDVTLLPGETYPSNNIHLIQILHSQFSSKEACCGTHVMNTADIEDFCVSGVQSLGSGGKSVTAVTGRAARDAKLTGQAVLQQVTSLHEQIKSSPPNNTQAQEELGVLLQSMKKRISGEVMPYRDQMKSFELLDSASKSLKDSARDILRLSLEEEMKQVLLTVTADVDCRFLVHCLHTTSQLDKIPLQKVTKMCPLHLPVIIFSYAENQLKARCCVPQAKVSPQVNAEAWMAPVLDALASSGGAPRGQDPRLVYNMKPLYVAPSNAQQLITKALDVARQRANKLFD